MNGEEAKKIKFHKAQVWRQIEEGSIPFRYMKNRIVLLSVDPYHLFTFWEVMEKAPFTVRVFDVTYRYFPQYNEVFSFKVENDIGDWYLNGKPSAVYLAQIGKIKKGKFILIAQSNVVHMPNSSVSTNKICMELRKTRIKKEEMFKEEEMEHAYEE